MLFGYGSLQDFKDATKVLAVVDQGGLGMPDRDYYLKEDARSEELRTKYLAHVQKMLELARGQARRRLPPRAKTVMEMETALAKVSLERVKRRDPENLYHKMKRDGPAGPGAGLPVGGVLHGHQRAGLHRHQRHAPRVLQGRQRAPQDAGAGPLEELPALAPDPADGADALVRVRERELRLLRQDADRAPRSCGRAGSAAWTAWTTTWATRSASATSRRPSARRARSAWP